jgi:hypothetical protein
MYESESKSSRLTIDKTVERFLSTDFWAPFCWQAEWDNKTAQRITAENPFRTNLQIDMPESIKKLIFSKKIRN